MSFFRAFLRCPSKVRRASERPRQHCDGPRPCTGSRSVAWLRPTPNAWSGALTRSSSTSGSDGPPAGPSCAAQWTTTVSVDRFLLTGSAAPIEHPTHSGAGRIVTMRMRLQGLAERGLVAPTVSLAELLTGRRPDVGGDSPLQLRDYAEEVVASGFPGIRSGPARTRRLEIDGYLDRIVERDFAAQGGSGRDPAGLRRWMAAYAAATSTTATYETIRDAASSAEGRTPARSTTLSLPRGTRAAVDSRSGAGLAAHVPSSVTTPTCGI